MISNQPENAASETLPLPGKINHQVNTQNNNNMDLEVKYTNRNDKLFLSPVDQWQFSHIIEQNSKTQIDNPATYKKAKSQ